MKNVPFGPGADRRSNGFLGLGGEASSTNPPNSSMGTNRGGTMPLGGGGSTVNPPNHAFTPGRTPDAPAATNCTGGGTVPVGPTSQGKPAGVYRIGK